MKIFIAYVSSFCYIEFMKIDEMKEPAMTTVRPSQALMAAFVFAAVAVFAIAATPLLHIATRVVA